MNEPMPGWQRGVPISRLQAFAEPFARQHKALCFGAFELVKERDIAAAMANGTLAWQGGPSGEVLAVAIARQLQSGGHFADFAGRSIKIPAGHLRVSAFAALDADAGYALLQGLRQRAPRRMWVDVFEEDALAREALGRIQQLQYCMTRIAAGSEIKGLYTTAPLGAMPLHRAENASVIVVDPNFSPAAERAAMLQEVEAYARRHDAWAQHYSTYNKRRSWTAFALRGFDAGDPGFVIKPTEMAQSWQAENSQRLAAVPSWTAAAGALPATMACLQRLLAGRGCERARLMRLTPGGELARHADVTNRDAGLADHRLARLHIPLLTSDKVLVHGWDKRGRQVTTRFPAGALCYLDQRKPHRVENQDAAVERIHLVVDMESDAALRAQIAEAYCAVHV